MLIGPLPRLPENWVLRPIPCTRRCGRASCAGGKSTESSGPWRQQQKRTERDGCDSPSGPGGNGYHIESLRYCPPGEWGPLLGLDRIPEAKTLRRKLRALTSSGQGQQWASALSRDWMAMFPETTGVLYVDGHVRVYTGSQTELPRHYVARQQLCLRATTD